MQAASATNWLDLTLMGSLLVVLITTVFAVRMIKARKRDPAVSGTCGRCGYMVRGLTTFSCPECGADLREVGINPPQNQDDSRRAIFVLVMFAAILCCAAIMFMLSARSSSSGPALPTQPVPVQPVAPAPSP